MNTGRRIGKRFVNNPTEVLPLRRVPTIPEEKVPAQLVEALQHIRFSQAHTVGEKFSHLRRVLPRLMRLIDNEQTGVWVADSLRRLIAYEPEVGEKYQLGGVAHDRSARVSTDIVGHYSWKVTSRGPVATDYTRAHQITYEPHLSMSEVFGVFGKHGGINYDVYRVLHAIGAEVYRTRRNESVVSMQSVVNAANHYLQQGLDHMRLSDAIELLKKAKIQIDYTTLNIHGFERGVVFRNGLENNISLDNLLAIIPQLAVRQKYLYPRDGKPWVSAHVVAEKIGVDTITMYRMIERQSRNDNELPVRTIRPDFHDFLLVHPEDAERLMSKVAVSSDPKTHATLRKTGISRTTLASYLADMRALGYAGIENFGTKNKKVFVMPRNDLDWLLATMPQYRRTETRLDFLKRKMKERFG